MNMSLRGEERRSMVWNLLNFSDAIIIEYNIINVGKERLKDVFLGYYSDPDISFGFDDLMEWDSENEIIFTTKIYLRIVIC